LEVVLSGERKNAAVYDTRELQSRLRSSGTVDVGIYARRKFDVTTVRQDVLLAAAAAVGRSLERWN